MLRTRSIVVLAILALLISTTASAQSPAASPATVAIADVWTATGGPDGMTFPNDMAIDPDGRLWVADTGNDRFTILNPDGTFAETWGSHGSGDGQFRLRRANGDGYGNIEFAPDGSFYVLDVGNRRVQHFGPDRTFLGSWGRSGHEPGQYTDPIGLQVAADGTVMVLECGRDVVEFYDPAGTVLGSIDVHPDGDGGFNCANSMVADPEGNLYVDSCCESGNVVEKFSPDGTLVWTANTTADGLPFRDQPAGIAVSDDGHVYVSVARTIQAFDGDGKNLAGWDGTEDGGAPLVFPYDLLIEGDTLYVADHAANVVRAFELVSSADPG